MGVFENESSDNLAPPARYQSASNSTLAFTSNAVGPGGSRDRVYFPRRLSYLEIPRANMQCRHTVDEGRRPRWKVFIHSGGRIVSLCDGVGGADGESCWLYKRVWRERENLRGVCDDVLTAWTSKVRESHRRVQQAHWYSAQAWTAAAATAAAASLLGYLLSYTKWGKSDFCHVILFLCLLSSTLG